MFNDLAGRLNVIPNSIEALKQYEDDFHYEASLAINLTAKSIDELELYAFRLCTDIAKGPWLFLKLPNKEIGFEFEAIFNHEAFIHNSPNDINHLKWAHIEVP